MLMNNPSPRLRISASLRLMVLMLMVAGCASTQSLTPDDRPPATDPAEVVARYNDNAMRLQRLWARAAAFFRYRDPDDGDMRTDQGDGHLLFVRPSRVAFATGKPGVGDVLWAGNNDRQFWLFDLRHDVAYVGSYARLGQPGSRPLPMPVRPDRLPSLLGLTPIDAEEAYVEWHGDDLLIEPRWGARRLLLDARTGLAKRVDLLDEKGHSLIVCELTGEKTVKQVEGESRPARIAAEAAIRVVGEEGGLTLKLSNPTDDPDKIDDRLFDLDLLLRKHKPETVEHLDGDAEEETTAAPVE